MKKTGIMLPARKNTIAAALVWSAWVLVCAFFIHNSMKLMRSYPIGKTSDIYEINRLAALRISQFENPYPYSFLIKTPQHAYALRYSYPPAGALVYALFVRWCDIRWVNCTFVIIAAFSIMLLIEKHLLALLCSVILLCNPVIVEITAGFTASHESVAVGQLMLAWLFYSKYKFRLFSAIALAFSVLTKQFYFPLGILLLVYFWRWDRKFFFFFCGSLFVILFPFAFTAPKEFFPLILGFRHVIGPVLTEHFFSPWMFGSPSLFYRLLPQIDTKTAIILTLLYLSFLGTILIYLIERTAGIKVKFEIILLWFCIWLLCMLFGIPKFNPSQYLLLILPGVVAAGNIVSQKTYRRVVDFSLKEYRNKR